MRSPSPFAIVLLAAGAALFIWGLNASDSLASGASRLFQGAPSNKAIVLLLAGAVVVGFGLVKLLRRPA